MNEMSQAWWLLPITLTLGAERVPVSLRSAKVIAQRLCLMGDRVQAETCWGPVACVLSAPKHQMGNDRILRG